MVVPVDGFVGVRVGGVVGGAVSLAVSGGVVVDGFKEVDEATVNVVEGRRRGGRNNVEGGNKLDGIVVACFG